MTSIPPARRRPGPRRVVAASLCVALALVVSATGCSKRPQPGRTSDYQNLGPKKVPAYLKGSIYEQVELANQEPLMVSSFGLVGQLRGTGDTKAPPAVRQW